MTEAPHPPRGRSAPPPRVRGEGGGEGRPIVELRDVHQAFGTFEVLKGVTFSVPKGGVVCVIGPSGSGKSTLLRCINGLVPIRSGSIRVADLDRKSVV